MGKSSWTRSTSSIKISLFVMVMAVCVVLPLSAFGANDKLVVQDSAGSTTVFKVDDTGTVIGAKLAMGTTSPQAPIHLNIGTQAVGTSLYSPSTGFLGSTQDNSFAADLTVADGTSTAGMVGAIRGVRARGTLASPTVPLTDDLVLSLAGGVWDSGKVYNSAQIAFKVDGTVSTSVAPQRIVFNLRNNGTGAYVERLTVKANGLVGISTAVPTTQLDITNAASTAGIRIRTSYSPTSSAACNTGEMAWDASYIYVCTASGAWKRAALTGGY